MNAQLAEQILFWVFAIGIVVTSGVVIMARNAIASAISLVACFFFLAGVYVLLWAHTIAVLQVLVYAGAIMVLFLFVIMLLSLTDSGPVVSITPSRLAGSAGIFALLAGLVMAIGAVPAMARTWADDPAKVAQFGTIKHLGAVLYTQWLFPFEAVSLLLLVAIVGAVVVAKSRI